MDVTRPATDEYVAIGAARQAAWVLSGETEPPAWQLTIDGVETGEPTEAVYEAYAKARADPSPQEFRHRPGSFPTMGLPGPMLIHEPYS